MRGLIVALAVGALALPAGAVASDVKFAGKVSPSGRLSFHIRKHNGHVRLVNLAFRAVPINCKGGTFTTSGNTKGSPIRVRQGRWRRTLANDARHPTAFLDFAGRLFHYRDHLRRAAGTIRIYGTKVPVDGGGFGHDCGSGVRDWHAHRTS